MVKSSRLEMSVSVWLITLLFTQVFVMFSDVPADGYCVELGHIEGKLQRGQILATGLRVRFSFCVVAGFIQNVMQLESSYHTNTRKRKASDTFDVFDHIYGIVTTGKIFRPL